MVHRPKLGNSRGSALWRFSPSSPCDWLLPVTWSITAAQWGREESPLSVIVGTTRWGIHPGLPHQKPFLLEWKSGWKGGKQSIFMGQFLQSMTELWGVLIALRGTSWYTKVNILTDQHKSSFINSRTDTPVQSNTYYTVCVWVCAHYTETDGQTSFKVLQFSM